MTIKANGSVLTASNGHLAYARDDGQWEVSWLPNRTVTRNQAITALVLAEYITKGVTSRAHPDWPHVRSFASELDLTATEAVAAVHRTNATLPNPTKKGPTTVGAIHNAIWHYQDAVRDLDRVIGVIEDLPVHQLPNGSHRTAASVLADAYALRRACTDAENALENALKP